MKQLLYSLLASCLCASSVLAEAAVTRILARQQWPWSKNIRVEYDVTGSSSNFPLDVTMTLFDGSQTVTIPGAALTGRYLGLIKSDTYVVEIDPEVIFPGRKSVDQITVTAELVAGDPANTNELYMVVDLDSGDVEHITQADILEGSYGSYEINPVSTNGAPIESVIWTGVTNGLIYRTQKMAFRRCPAGSFMMGVNADRPVTLTKDFYIGVFETTHDQEARISWSRYFFTNELDRAYRPSDYMSCAEVRGTALTTPPYTCNWPTNREVASSSVLGKLRSTVTAQTGLTLNFDLPTEAQWEYACRAETTGDLNDGSATISAAALNQLARYSGTSPIGSTSTDALVKHLSADQGGTAIVGSYRPNAWGLYDMHGNVSEYCLDWYYEDLTTDPVTDPESEWFTGDTKRVRRCPGWYTAISGVKLTVGARYGYVYTSLWKDQGYRICLTVEE